MNKNKEQLLNKRYKAEQRFRLYGQSAIFMALLFLTIFIFKIFSTGYSAFQKTWLIVPVTFDAELMMLEQNPSNEDLQDADYYDIALKSMADLDLNANEDQENELKRMVSYFFEKEIKNELLNDPSLIGKTKEVYLTASDDLDQVFKGNYPRDLPENQRRVSDYQLKIFDQLVANGKVESKFNISFFTNADSREAELAGIASSFMGSIFSILVCLMIAFPVAVLAAIYLEEFAPKNRFTDFIEVNINNLAAVPSIVFWSIRIRNFIGNISITKVYSISWRYHFVLNDFTNNNHSCQSIFKSSSAKYKRGSTCYGSKSNANHNASYCSSFNAWHVIRNNNWFSSSFRRNCTPHFNWNGCFC